MEEVSEEQLQEAEEAPADHRHAGLEPIGEALRDHLVSVHSLDVPERLSAATLEGMHDRFHGEAHAADD